MNFLNRLRASFQRFMQGRYGTDTLNRHLIIFWLFLAVLNVLFQSLVIYILELILCLTVFFRMFSKNIIKRQRENAAYYQFSQKLNLKKRHISTRFRERKTTRFFHCPHCSAPIRMPRKIGRFHIRCPKCGHNFTKEFKN